MTMATGDTCHERQQLAHRVAQYAKYGANREDALLREIWRARGRLLAQRGAIVRAVEQHDAEAELARLEGEREALLAARDLAIDELAGLLSSLCDRHEESIRLLALIFRAEPYVFVRLAQASPHPRDAKSQACCALPKVSPAAR
jgi:hypothetical protein